MQTAARSTPESLPIPLPDQRDARVALVDMRLALAREARASGDRGRAVTILCDSMRAGLWNYPRLWSELWALMESPADFTEIRALWLESPKRCHKRVPLLRTVARAASVAGEHEEARMLLRKAIVLQASRAKRLRSRLGRAKRRIVAELRDGLSRPDPEAFEQRAGVALTALNAEFKRLDVRSFLISGTLLGFVRESRFIGWDKDIDVGFFTSEIEPAELEKAFERSADFHVRRLDFNTDRLRVNHTNGMMIDIFPHYEGADGKVWHDGTTTRWWNEPFELATVEFLGQTQYVPDPPERYLDDNYGDWRTPDPHFDARLDAPNAEVTDREFLNTLLYFSLLDAVVKQDTVKRKRYLGLLADLGEGDWLDRTGS